MYSLIMKFAPGMENGIPGQLAVVFLFVGWFCGMAVCTMEAPFAGGGYEAAGNGWYSTWVCLICSGLLFKEANPFGVGNQLAVLYPADSGGQYLAASAFAAFIEMWHASYLCDKDQYCEGMVAYAVAAGALPLLLCLLFAIVPQLKACTQYLAIFLALWWICCVLALTMPADRTDCGHDTYCKGVFLETGNGFCACWAAMFFSCMLAAHSNGLDEGVDGAGGDASGGGGPG